MERERESEGGLESWAVEEKEEESEGGLAVTLSLPSRLPQQEREAEAASVLRPSVLWRRRPRYVGGKNDDMPACVARPPVRPLPPGLPRPRTTSRRMDGPGGVISHHCCCN